MGIFTTRSVVEAREGRPPTRDTGELFGSTKGLESREERVLRAACWVLCRGENRGKSRYTCREDR